MRVSGSLAKLSIVTFGLYKSGTLTMELTFSTPSIIDSLFEIRPIVFKLSSSNRSPVFGVKVITRKLSVPYFFDTCR